MLPERDAVFIAQMIEAAQAALDFTEGLGKETVLDTRVVSFAMVRAVQLVGQAARNVSDDVRAVNPDIPWHQIIGMRRIELTPADPADLAVIPVGAEQPICFSQQIKRILNDVSNHWRVDILAP